MNIDAGWVSLYSYFNFQANWTQYHTTNPGQQPNSFYGIILKVSAQVSAPQIALKKSQRPHVDKFLHRYCFWRIHVLHVVYYP